MLHVFKKPYKMKNIKSYKFFESKDSPFQEVINTLEDITLELKDLNYGVKISSEDKYGCDMIYVEVYGNSGQDNFLFDECLLRIKDYMHSLGFSIHLELINKNYDNILDIGFYNKKHELSKPNCAEWKKKQL